MFNMIGAGNSAALTFAAAFSAFILRGRDAESDSRPLILPFRELSVYALVSSSLIFLRS